MNGAVSLALRSLLRNRRRTLIALSSIAFGVAALIVAGGFVDSLLVKLREDTIHSQSGHLQIQHPKFLELGLSKPYAQLLPADASTLGAVEGMTGVEAVMPRLGINGLVSVGDTTLSFTGQGIDPAKDRALAPGLPIVAGTRLRPDDYDGVLLGEGLAENLGVKPGDKLALLVTAANGTFNGMDVELRGTFRTVSKSYDDIALRLPLAAAERLLRVNGAQQWLVLLNDTETTDDLFRRIAGMLPPDRYSLTRWDQEAHFYHQTAELFSRQFGFMRIVITTLIVLSILNTMTMNVLERTWEVGVMLSVGDTRRQVLTLFMLEGAVLGAVGSVVGMAVGLASAAVINTVGIPMPAPPGMSHGFQAGVALSAWVIASALCIGAITALLASLPPSIRASRMQIVVALRTHH